MPNLRKKIEKILKEFKNDLDTNLVGDGKWQDECFIQATNQILQTFREVLPKEMKGRFVVGAQDSGHWVMTEEAEGFNTRLAQIREEMDDYVGFCTECRYKIKSFEGLTKCPNCGTAGIPCAVKNDVTIKINWHELRILCIWAENWGRKINSAGTIYGIAHALQEQFPQKAPLTLAGEVNQLKDGIIPNLKDVHFMDGEGNEIQT